MLVARQYNISNIAREMASRLRGFGSSLLAATADGAFSPKRHLDLELSLRQEATVRIYASDSEVEVAHGPAGVG